MSELIYIIEEVQGLDLLLEECETANVAEVKLAHYLQRGHDAYLSNYNPTTKKTLKEDS